jgi:hypothetical protein
VKIEEALYKTGVAYSLLPMAPSDADSRSIAQRLREGHSCAGCDKRADVAYIADTPSENRWLDLCFEHSVELQQHVTVSSTEGF